MSKECADKFQELMSGITYWDKKNSIYIDTEVFFVKIVIEDIVKKLFNPGVPVAMYEIAESGISPLMVKPSTIQIYQGRDLAVRGGCQIPRHKNSIWGISDEESWSKALHKKLVWTKVDVGHVFCIVVGVVWGCVPLILLGTTIMEGV